MGLLLLLLLLLPHSTQTSPKTTPRQHVQNISMANFAKVLTVISAALLIVESAEGISCLKGIRSIRNIEECGTGITQCQVLKHGPTASDVMSCSTDTERRPVGCRTGNVKGTKVRSVSA